MTTKVKDNQLLDSYIPITTPHIKSVATTDPNVFVVNDGAGNITIHFGSITIE